MAQLVERNWFLPSGLRVRVPPDPPNFNEEKKMKISKIVKNNVANFEYYRKDFLYYSVVVDDDKYMFPIPCDDLDGATVKKKENAMLFMRYIRKAIEEGSFVLFR